MRDKKPIILIIENSIDVTGALKSIVRTTYNLKEKFDFHFIIPSKSRSKKWISEKGFSGIYELPMRELRRRVSSVILYLPALLLNTIRLKRIVRNKKIDFIHVNDLYNLLPVALRFLGMKIPYACHIRFMPDKFHSKLFNFWLNLHLKYADSIIVVSKAVMKNMPPHPKLMVIYDELPGEEEYHEEVTSDLKENQFTFLYLANYIQGKGQNFAIEAFAQISTEMPNWKLRFVGGDMGINKNKRFRSQLVERTKELGLFEKTEWIGFVEEVEQEYKRADVILNFSESESFSITCLEASFFGRPVIATNCGGPAEIIENGITGYLVANRNIEEMISAMRILANNSELRIKMGTMGKESVRTRFGVENTSRRLESMYRLGLSRV